MVLLPHQIMLERSGDVLGPQFDDPGAKIVPQQKPKARRRLEFGASDDTHSGQFVAELLDKMHQEDKGRWNFDFETGCPTSGSSSMAKTGWEWTRVTNARRKLDFGGEGGGEDEERQKWMFQVLEGLHREQVERWNFDFLEERPLPEGDWEWTKMGVHEDEHTKSDDKDPEGAETGTRKRASCSAETETVTSDSGESSSKLLRIEERTG